MTAVEIPFMKFDLSVLLRMVTQAVYGVVFTAVVLLHVSESFTGIVGVVSKSGNSQPI